jgi:anti-anti-sigma regulatory factor
MRAGSGEAGRQLVAQGQYVEAGSRSIVGWCVASKEPRLAPDVGADPMYLPVPLLPDTRSEMAIPLRIGDRVIGALDVQSERLNAFTEDEVTVFRTMADQLAVAIENARVLDEMFGMNENLQRTLETQARLMETIAALSTPVVPLMRGIILLPLVGNIDSARSQQILDQLLSGVQTHRAQVAIVDITGVPVVDTGVANSLVQAARAVGLLGAEVVLVGIRPEVAQTMVMLGVDVARVATHSNLQNGIEYALWRLGYRIAPRQQ